MKWVTHYIWKFTARSNILSEELKKFSPVSEYFYRISENATMTKPTYVVPKHTSTQIFSLAANTYNVACSSESLSSFCRQFIFIWRLLKIKTHICLQVNNKIHLSLNHTHFVSVSLTHILGFCRSCYYEKKHLSEGVNLWSNNAGSTFTRPFLCGANSEGGVPSATSKMLMGMAGSFLHCVPQIPNSPQPSCKIINDPLNVCVCWGWQRAHTHTTPAQQTTMEIIGTLDPVWIGPLDPELC